MAGSVQRQKVYVQVTELCLLAKALRAASIPPESPAKARQIDPRFTRLGSPRRTRRARRLSSNCGRRQRMTATTELGVAVMTVLSIAAALTCRLDRLATARFLPPIFGLMLAIGVLLALIAIGQHDSALATLVILDVMLLWYALTTRGHVLTARLERLRRDHALSNRAHPNRWPNPPSQPPKDNEDDGQR